MQKIHFTWDDISRYTIQLAREIPHPDVIVSLGKGGSIPGVILAEYFGVRNLNFGMQSYDKHDRGKITVYQEVPDIADNADAAALTRVLLVDDIADSGHTFMHAMKHFTDRGWFSTMTASLFYKTCSVYEPKYKALTVDKDHWVVFPWEALE